MIKILLIEDDQSIISSLCEFLTSEGFLVDFSTGQKDGLKKLENNNYDLMLLDVSLKDGNGFVVCRTAKDNYNIPIIFLTASGDEGSVVTGLELGADDYIIKPFRPRELISRIKNALRKYEPLNKTIKIDNIVIDMDKVAVYKNNEYVYLSALEFKILNVFISNRGKLISREHLLEEIWDIAGNYVNDNTLTVYIKRIREKLEDEPSNPKIIKTVRGLGYRVD